MFKSVAFLALALIDLVDGDRNGTGYFDGLVKRKFNQICRACDEYGRNILIIPTELGNIVAFERFSQGTQDIWVFNTPPGTRQIFFTSASDFEKTILENRVNGILSIEEQDMLDYLRIFHFMNDQHREDCTNSLGSTLQRLGWHIVPKDTALVAI
jgi:hypothetical protein